jgi:uncharacterized protein YbgA (DUF1722 family)
MSHDFVANKQLGRFLASADITLELMAEQYISGLMAVLTLKATRKNHANTLSHIQSYFIKHLGKIQRKELSAQIDAYCSGLMLLVMPLTLIKHYLFAHPKSYLAQQSYLNPYPESLKLRYGY